MGLFGDIVRGAADIMTFGTNEVVGNPAGKLADQITNPTDPNAANNALNAQSLAISQANNAAQLRMAQQNIDLEKEFAQNGISWRIADAAKNGISPLAALGASEPGYSPVSAVMNSPSFIPNQVQPSLRDNLFSAGASELGQGLARSLLSQAPAIDKASASLDLAYKAKQNDLLDVQIALAKKNLVTQPGTPPGLPAWTSMLNRDGTTSFVPTSDAAQASHGEPFGGTIWQIHNNLIPTYEAGKGALLDYLPVQGFRDPAMNR